MLSAWLTWPTYLFAVVADAQLVFKVPDVKLLPAAKPNNKIKLLALSLSKDPVVSPAKVNYFFSQVFDDEIV